MGAGRRLSGLLVGGGIPFIPFFQEGGYTGEYEGLAYLHKHELVINEGILNKIKADAVPHMTMTIPASILKPPVAAPRVSRGLSRADREYLVNEVSKAVKNNITVELRGKAGDMFDVFVDHANERGRRVLDRRVSK